MTQPARVGVFLCQGGHSRAESLEYKRLGWIAQTGGLAGVYEICQACQDQGAQALARLVEENHLDGVLLAACPLAQSNGPLRAALTQAGLPAEGLITVPVCRKPEREAGSCQVSEGASQELLQALAAVRDRDLVACEAQEVSPRVLVVGHGLLALTAARELASAGRPVTLLTPGKRLAPPEPLWGVGAGERARELAAQVEEMQDVEILRQAELLTLRGSAGRFTVELADRQGRPVHLEVGAVLMTQGPPQTLNWPGPGLAGHEQVVSLDELALLAAAPRHLAQRTGQERPRVALALGMHQESGPRELQAALDTAQVLMDELQASCALYVRQLKVAAPELERLSQKARAQGMILFKLTNQAIEVDRNGQGLAVICQDEILGRPIRQEVDLLALDQSPVADPLFMRLAARLGLTLGPGGSLQPDRVGALPIHSPRGGVLLVGEARGSHHLSLALDELAEALWEVQGLLGGGQVEVPCNLVKVDRKKCALCLTCVRVCPNGAMDRLERRPFANPLVCTACGTCASECPMDAIQLLGQEDARYNQRIKAAVGSRPSLSEVEADLELLVLACSRSAAEAIGAARLAGEQWPGNARLVQVPCAGKIDPQIVLDALREGMDGVLVLACHPQACYSLEGNIWAGYRMGHLRELLTEAGLEPERLQEGSLAASNQAQALGLVREALANLEKLGPSPLKTAARERYVLKHFAVSMDRSYTIL